MSEIKYCPKCGKICPLNEYACYGKHEDCEVENLPPASATRSVPSDFGQGRITSGKKRKNKPKPE